MRRLFPGRHRRPFGCIIAIMYVTAVAVPQTQWLCSGVKISTWHSVIPSSSKVVIYGKGSKPNRPYHYAPVQEQEARKARPFPPLHCDPPCQLFYISPRHSNYAPEVFHAWCFNNHARRLHLCSIYRQSPLGVSSEIKNHYLLDPGEGLISATVTGL